MEDIITLQDVSLVYSTAETLSVKKIVKMLLHRQRRPKLRSEYQALHDISFSIQRGSVYGIIGRNGAGKSTLLRILSGAMSPTSGSVERRYRTINLLALGVGFTKDLTGYENIFLNGMILGFSRQEIQENLQEIISYSELGDFIYKPMKTYSSGMISRLAFSIGIHLKPDVLLVDEILSVGDARFQEKSFRSIREYIESENTTAVLVSHSMQQIRSLCERCIWIEKGDLIAIGDTQAVTDAYDRVNRGELTLAQAKDLLRQETASCASGGESCQEDTGGKQPESSHGQEAADNGTAKQIRKSPRLTPWMHSVCAKAGSRVKKRLHRAAAWLYRKLMPYPRVLRLCSRVNRRLRLIRDPQRVLSETAAPRKAISADTELPTASQLRVAAVVDEFTYNSFRFECRMLPVEPDNWKQIFAENKIDIFFCESAWSGVDSQRRPWKGQVYASCNFPRENRRALLDILGYCRKHRIPTVFWNKEDPTHYEDKVHNFVDTAIRFDHIFTTDDACVERYRKEYNHPSVHCLPFATQPRLFNPIETRERTDEIIFAGSWYRQHEERSREMERILDQILAQGLPLKIYDRYFGSTDPNHVFPERFRKYLHPALRHDEMDDAYKASLYALNINTVVDSDTMFARRVFELMSCNTLVLSNYSRGMERLFGDNVLFVDGETPISLENAGQKRENCLYEVLRNHTYGVRWRRVLQCIGYPYREDSHEVCFFYQVRNPEEAAAAAGHFNALSLPEKSAVFLVSAQTSSKDLRQILEQYQNRWVRVVSERYCRTYQDALQLTAPYFVFADTQLAADFPEKALLHDAYLAGEAGIIQGSCRYRFTEHEGLRNVLCPARLFDQAKQDFYSGKPSTHKVYVI